MKSRWKEDEKSRSEDELSVMHLANSYLDSVPQEVLSVKTLVSLNLSNNVISSLPSTFVGLKNLKVLHLSSNNLRSFPAHFNQLFFLEVLSLGANLLTSSAVEQAGLDKLQNLRQLNLCRNQLTYMPESLCEIDTLTHLSLTDNRIECMPAGFVKLKSLQFFGISNNKLTTFNGVLHQLPSLRGVSLAGNPLIDAEESQREIVKLSGNVPAIHIMSDESLHQESYKSQSRAVSMIRSSIIGGGSGLGANRMSQRPQSQISSGTSVPPEESCVRSAGGFASGLLHPPTKDPASLSKESVAEEHEPQLEACREDEPVENAPGSATSESSLFSPSSYYGGAPESEAVSPVEYFSATAEQPDMESAATLPPDGPLYQNTP